MSAMHRAWYRVLFCDAFQLASTLTINQPRTVYMERIGTKKLTLFRSEEALGSPNLNLTKETATRVTTTRVATTEVTTKTTVSPQRPTSLKRTVTRSTDPPTTAQDQDRLRL